ncbi:MAG: hypothetical protein JKY93_12520 [Gammaproteobacteria bacterium]|nr:hypothetical protein [Gammaproteobacteria bacterium]
MSKLATDAMIDGGLDKMATCVTLTVCAGQPTSFANIAARKLAAVVIDSGDFSKANGDVSGRKLTVASQADIPITGTGTQNGDHIVIDDGTDYVVTTSTSQPLTNGGTVTTPAYDIEVTDPS